MSPAYISRVDAASYLGLSSRTIDRLLAEKKIASYKMRGRVMFRVADLDAYAESVRVEAAAPVPMPRPQQDRPAKPDWRARMRARA